MGVVGEIYVKYSPLGNNDLENFLRSQDCEVNLPGLMGFVQYCAYNPSETARLYGGTFLEKHVSDFVLKYIEGMESVVIKVLRDNGYHAPLPFRELIKLTDGVIVSREINIFGMGESSVEEILREPMTTLTNPHLGPLRQAQRVHGPGHRQGGDQGGR